MEQDFSQFQYVFFEESLELINNIERTLVHLDPSHVDSETINAIFRCAHTIKSGSGMFGFSSIMQFTHLMENYLELVRSEQKVLSTFSIDILLKSVDCLRNMIYALQENKASDDTLALELEKEYHILINNGSENTHPVLAVNEEQLPVTSWKIYFKPNLMIFQNGDDPLRIIRSLQEIGEMHCDADISTLLTVNEFHPDDCYLAWNIFLNSSKTEKEIRQFAFEWVEDDSIINFTAQTDNPTNPQPILRHEPFVAKTNDHVIPSVTPNKEALSIRVATEKVDTLVNLVGELIITQLMLTQICQSYTSSSLKEGLLRLAQNCNELQDNVMRIRMLPISHLFNRFPRMARDICKSNAKQIELIVTGENTELDKTVLERISDPLIHLVRNSLDHGIENIDERVKANKSSTGTLHLQAFHQGSNIVIKISDDGRGLNQHKILERAKSMELLNSAQDLTTEQINEFIFLPGFSTADKITDISGRGVGLDVARKNIEALGGKIGVESVPHKGTTFTISLPLTLAIMEGQLIRVGEFIYIVPLISMNETIQIKKENVRTIGENTQMYFLRSHYIPIVKLYEIFRIPVKDTSLESQLLVIIEYERQFYGILIDELLELQQVVIKNMQNNYGSVTGIAGATILGDGSVALILDAPAIIREFIQQKNAPSYSQTIAKVG